VFFHSIALACLVGVLVMLQAYLPTGIWSCSGDAFGPLLALGGPDPLAEPKLELANAETLVRNSRTMPFRHLRRLKVTATSKACGMAYALKAARKGSPYFQRDRGASRARVVLC
jgi:hypothetical protein